MITRRGAARDRDSEARREALLLTAVDTYRARGWTPFPLPVGAKLPPPKGITGASARPVTGNDYRRWHGEWANLGLVLADGLVGIDADVYKNGNTRPAGLPPTVRSTSRDDGSGIYLFKVPPGTRLQGLVPGVGEVIQWFHRYAVVWPSIHPEGRTYRWLDDDDNEVGIPRADDLPLLPEKWLRRLQDHTKPCEGNAFGGDVDDWLDSLPDGPMSRVVREALKRSVQALRRSQATGTCRYDTMVRGTRRLVALGAARHRGVGQALDSLIDEYVALIDGERARKPYGELDRAISGAVAKFGGRR